MAQGDLLRIDVGLSGSEHTKTLSFHINKPAAEVLSMRGALSTAVSATYAPWIVIDNDKVATLLTDRLARSSELKWYIDLVCRVVAMQLGYDLQTETEIVYDGKPSDMNLQSFMQETARKEEEARLKADRKPHRGHLRLV
ncbi:MAG: hypothetical protein JWO54_452 [Candidatus Saccharibacteria bacterium]|nr:hypothetical protein [Candidatus Saccharibacteria bacterium]MDB5180692.1 hypothetical protein [Candidatus Saccharibacteria bacterium]